MANALHRENSHTGSHLKSVFRSELSMKEGHRSKQLELRLQQGDVSALEELYQQYHPELYLYALKLTNSQDLAKDAIQDTFVAIWKYRSNLAKANSMRFYLLQALRNQCLKILKKRRRFLSLGQQSPEMVIHPEELKLKDTSQETKQKITQALYSLSNRQREIIYLKYYENLDYQEIAKLLSINYQSVVNHVHRAIVRLRDADVLKLLER